jgi:hypothetical protein
MYRGRGTVFVGSGGSGCGWGTHRMWRCGVTAGTTASHRPPPAGAERRPVADAVGLPDALQGADCQHGGRAAQGPLAGRPGRRALHDYASVFFRGHAVPRGRLPCLRRRSQQRARRPERGAPLSGARLPAPVRARLAQPLQHDTRASDRQRAARSTCAAGSHSSWLRAACSARRPPVEPAWRTSPRTRVP